MIMRKTIVEKIYCVRLLASSLLEGCCGVILPVMDAIMKSRAKPNRVAKTEQDGVVTTRSNTQ